MGYRLSQIYTRTGDDGSTGLADGTRILKNAVRIELIGKLDDLNCLIGLVLTQTIPNEISGCLNEIQHLIFDLGGDLSIPGRCSIEQKHILWLELWIDHFNDVLPPLKEFILPGGNLAATYGHLARTACRSAERTAVALSQNEDSGSHTLAFLNRLSDLLFVMSRILARTHGCEEVMWRKERTAPVPRSGS